MFWPTVDWIAIWNIYSYPFIFWVYMVLAAVVRLLMSRHMNRDSRTKAILIGVSASLLIVRTMPFLAIPAYVIIEIIAGPNAVFSIFMALPVVACIGVASTFLDAAVLRLLLRQPIHGKLRLVFAINFLVISLTSGVIIARILIWPPQMIAMLDNWR